MFENNDCYAGTLETGFIARLGIYMLDRQSYQKPMIASFKVNTFQFHESLVKVTSLEVINFLYKGFDVSRKSSNIRTDISTGGVYSCRLPSQVQVDDLQIDVTKPTFEDNTITNVEEAVSLSTIVDGSMTKELEFSSEVIVYLELNIPSGFEVGIRTSRNCSKLFQGV